MTASPSQLTPRMSMREAPADIRATSLLRYLAQVLSTDWRLRLWILVVSLAFFTQFPPIMDPKPIGWITTHCFFKRSIHIDHDGFRRTCVTVFVSGNSATDFDRPPGKPNPKAKTCVEGSIISQGEDCRRGGSRTIMSQERYAQSTVTSMLIGQQTQQNAAGPHRVPQGFRFEPPLEEQAS